MDTILFAMDFYTDTNSPTWETDWDEAWEYQPGFTVELKSQPGILHTIESYDPTMVPPVGLADDPMPHYPHELRVVSRSSKYTCLLPTQCLLPTKISPSQSQLCRL